MRKKIMLWVCAAVVLLLAAAVVALFPMLTMTPTETGDVAGTNILAVRNNRNSLYFIRTESGYVVVDAGTDRNAIANALADLSIEPATVRHVLLTHSDADHVGALPLFANTEIHISQDELPLVNGTVRRSPLGYNSLPEGVRASAADPLSDGQELDLDGLSVLCVKTPGHTPGSMSYLVDGKYLFTGDAVRVSGGKLWVHPFTMDEREAQASIERLRGAKDNAVLLLTAHYGYYANVE